MPWYFNWLMVWASLAAPGREMVDRVVAVIDNDIITLRELEAKAAPMLQNLQVEQPSANAAQQAEVLRRVLDTEIGERVVAREIRANRERLAVSDKDVEHAIDEVMKMNHLNREQLQSYLYTQSLTWREYHDKLRTQLERARLFQTRVQGKVQIVPADVRRRCLERQRLADARPEICAAHILLRVAANSKASDVAAVRAQTERLRTELLAGADFTQLARAHSADTAAVDGSLGCFGRGEMLESFEAAAFALTIGDISVPVRTSHGYHLIRVSERRTVAASGCQKESDLDPFRQELYQESMQRQEQLWVDDLRRKAFVEVRL